MRRIRGELLYALTGFPWAAASLVAVAAMVFVGTALSVTLVGLPVLALALVAARSAARVDRAAARRLLGVTVEPPGPGRPGRGPVGWTWERLRDAAGWRALLYRVVKAPLALLAVVVSLIFWGYGLAALTYPVWWSYVPAQTDSHGRGRQGLGLVGDVYLDTWPAALATAGVGLLLLGVAPWAVRAAVAPDTWLIRGLLGGGGQPADRIRILEQTRAHAVEDAAIRLREIERNLHDGAQPQLVALAMRLDMARTMLSGDTSPPDLDRILTLIDAAHRGATDAIGELRDLAQGIHPPILDSGLEAALHTVAARSALPVDLSVTLAARPSAAVETCLYFCATELVNNAAKHSGARRVAVDVTDRYGVIRLVVRDDGNGGVRLGGGTGLDGLIERLGAFDGRLHIDSRPGGPSTVTVEVPDHA
ncbi:sensor histidine kinase [Couchioplanes caeruleus]|uniref:histidine kinase n=2 Tax=Couchioplanes caeruleus TaxID=56438 RepID=A0A1K0FRT9_9ACTN|nr:sensor histidine kinase [Couchioplanes caeruleus]OJF15559.1 Histidine kinase [Couchioplanes caeruleus subsp. caeruleus]ROP30300.1 histidine kinase [Couchioplanes caeruleus]